MSPDDQRIALAEFGGWTKIRLATKGAGAPERTASPHGVPPGRNYEAPLPNYLSDLNAVHEVIGKLHVEQWGECWNQLSEIVMRVDGTLLDYRWMEINATAAQRCEALLRTIGKWKD